MASLQTRVVNILKDPKSEWPVIAAESTDIGRLYREYIIPLSAIPVVAGFIGTFLVTGVTGTVGMMGEGLMWVLGFAIVSYLAGLVLIHIDAVIIEWLAPKFAHKSKILQNLTSQGVDVPNIERTGFADFFV